MKILHLSNGYQLVLGYNGNYGFAKFGQVVNSGEKIKEGVLSNASILKYNLNTWKAFDLCNWN